MSKADKTFLSAVVVANASELAAHVVMSLAGKQIGNTVAGQKLALNEVRALAIARFQSKLKLTN
jgi:ABC-type iron transport system FetAB permease component